MTQYTLVSADVLYIAFYLKEEDPTTGSITAYDLSTASSIVFSMRNYNASTNTISGTMETINITGSLNTDGFIRKLCTIPSVGTFRSEVEVFSGAEKVTWKGPIYLVTSELA